MSSITKLDNGRWKARWRTPEGASRSETFDRKVDAEQKLTSIGHKKLTGEYIDPMASRVTFKVYAETWLERKRATTRPTTSATFESHLKKHITPRFGQVALCDISREEVKRFASSLSESVAPTTARAIVFTMAAVLREAVDDNRIARNPAERIRVGAKTERRVEPMHVAGVAAKVPALADAMPARWRAAVLLMATTGLRLGECLGLTVDRVDFLRRTIRIDRQLANTAGRADGFGPPKTSAGKRLVSVPKSVTDMLAAHLAQFPAGDHGLIFTLENGKAIPRSTWSDNYRTACAAVGVDGRTRTHDLRHVAASSLIAGGLSVAAVQAVLGHHSASETLDVYTHLWPTDEDRTREAMERAAAGWLTQVG